MNSFVRTINNDIQKPVQAELDAVELTQRVEEIRARYDRHIPGWAGKMASRNDLPVFENIHKGKRCFVIGNGPSLNRIDMTKLKNEITLGSNRIFLGFQKWNFAVTYWMSTDETQLIQSVQDYTQNLPPEVIKLIPTLYIEPYEKIWKENLYAVNVNLFPIPYPQVSANPSVIMSGFTVTINLIQMALVMGCNPIYLVGVDNNYAISKEKIIRENRWTDPSSTSHFHPDYSNANNNHEWTFPAMELSDPAYFVSRKLAESMNVNIFNATPDSKLDAFKHVNFYSLF